MNEVVEREEKFVRIPLKMFAYGTEHYVTDDEIAVYYELGFHCWGRDVSVSNINVELLHARLEWHNGKNRIIEALSGLRTKNYIAYNCDDVKAITYLTINMPRVKSKLYEDKVKVGGTTYTAWEGINETIMNACKQDKANTGRRLKVLTYVLWRSKIGYRIAYEEWENVLQVSESTAKRLIKRLKEEGLINVVSGKYYTDLFGNVRQEINKYDVTKSKVEDENSYKPTETEKHRKMMKVAELLLKTTDERVHKRTNLLEYGSTLDVEDMVIYMTTECLIVKKIGKERYNAISKSLEGREMVESWRQKAKKEIENPSKKKVKPNEVTPYVDTNNSIDMYIFDYDDYESPEEKEKNQIWHKHREEKERKRKEEEKEREAQEFREWLEEMEEMDLKMSSELSIY